MFYLEYLPKLDISFIVMLLHHAHIIDLFSKENSKKNCASFKKFLDFISDKSDFISDNNKIKQYFKLTSDYANALSFAYKYDIENKGLFCINNIDDIDQNFINSFKNFVNKLQALWKIISFEAHINSENITEYQNTFTELNENIKKYHDSKKNEENNPDKELFFEN